MQERQVVVNGLLTSYITGGTGETVLMLHGWGDSKETFQRISGELSKSHRVIAPDLPGFGKTQSPHEVWGLEEYAVFVRDFLTKVQPGALVLIIAHSNGASVAIKGLATNVLTSGKVVLIGAAGIRNRQKGKRIALKVIAKGGKVVTFWLPMANKQRLRKRLYGVVGSDLLVAPHLQETFKRTVKQDVQTDATQLDIPALLIYGEDDKATPPLYGRIFAELIPHAQLEIITGTGHFVHHDAADVVLQHIQEFLK